MTMIFFIFDNDDSLFINKTKQNKSDQYLVMVKKR
jgi:hypothetical protein